MPRARSSQPSRASGRRARPSHPRCSPPRRCPRRRLRRALGPAPTVNESSVVSPSELMRQSFGLELPVNQTASPRTAIAVVSELSTSFLGVLPSSSPVVASSFATPLMPPSQTAPPPTAIDDAAYPSVRASPRGLRIERDLAARVDARDLAPPALQGPDGAVAHGEDDDLAKDGERPGLLRLENDAATEIVELRPDLDHGESVFLVDGHPDRPRADREADGDPLAGDAAWCENLHRRRDRSASACSPSSLSTQMKPSPAAISDDSNPRECLLRALPSRGR